jgi:hypothetical protein
VQIVVHIVVLVDDVVDIDVLVDIYMLHLLHIYLFVVVLIVLVKQLPKSCYLLQSVRLKAFFRSQVLSVASFLFEDFFI